MPRLARAGSSSNQRFHLLRKLFRTRIKPQRQTRHLLLESLEDRRLMTVDWRNPVNSLDVSGDGFISPLDALQPINELNDNGPHALADQRPADNPYWDASGDQFISPIDALQVINALNDNRIVPYVLGESQQIAAEQSVTITVGQTTGTRTYRLQVDANFDATDTVASSDDLLAIYLVDPQQPATTLLDRGTPGTTLFTLSESGAEYAPGRVRWDGEIVEIDLSELTTRDTAELRLQLLNTDGDRGSRVAVRPLTNEVEASGVSGPKLLDATTPAAAGAAVNLAGLATVDDVNVQIENVRYDSATQHYVAELRLQNAGESLGRSVAVAFPDLPSGVTLRNPSGTTTDGDPYINFAPAISRGGLSQNGRSEPLLVEFDDPTRVPFALVPQIMAGTNQPPTLAAIDPLTVMPGGQLATQLTATDPDADVISFSLGATEVVGGSPDPLTLPTGTLHGDGLLEFTPAPGQLGTYTFDVVASDGVLEARRTVTLNVVADPNTTTRVSGFILDVDQLPLAGMQVEIGAVQGLTQSDGSFTLDLGSGPVVGDTLKVRGETFTGNSPQVYPFIAEKLAFILEHEVFAGVNNVIDRPIFLPPLDVAGGTTIDPMQDTMVQQEVAPGEMVEVFVAAGTLMNQQGTPFTGTLSITEVPSSLTPAALPDNLFPDLVVTIQPGEMVFATPAPLTLPNRAGWSPGMIMDIWSINPVDGEFDDVGDAQVSTDGLTVETISGGIRNSSWHFTAPQPPKPKPKPDNDGCDECEKRGQGNSELNFHSGAVTEAHQLANYQSLGETRGVMLSYDSVRADARPIIHFAYDDVNPSIFSVPDALKVVARLSVNLNGVDTVVPGFANAPQFGLQGGEHFFSIPAGGGPLDAALQADLRDHPTGVYPYTLTTGTRGFTGSRFIGSADVTRDQLVHVNTVNSPFGSGWGIAGLQELVENADGSLLMVDGGGSEMLFKKAASEYVAPPGDFSTLEKLVDGTFRRTMPDQTVYSFDTAGRLVNMRDRNGNEMHYEYDTAGLLTTITDPVGLATTFTYDLGKLATITDPAGRITQFDHDAAGNLIRVTDPDGSQRNWEYDADHHMTAETNQRGDREQSFYDEFGRARRAVLADGSVIQIKPGQVQGLYPFDRTIDPSNAPPAFRSSTGDASYIDANGNVIRTVLDAAGQEVSSSDNVGPLPTVERNSDNLITKLTDARGNPTRFTYDARGNVLSETINPSGICVSPPAEIVSWYSGDGYPNDLQGQNNGALRNGAGFGPGQVGAAFLFDGINDFVRVEDPADGSLDVTGDLAIDAWINPSVIAGGSRTIVQKQSALADNDITYRLSLESEGRLTFTSRQGGGPLHTVESSTSLRANEWSHVAVTIGQGTLRLYINGAEAASSPYAFVRPATDGPLTMGLTVANNAGSAPFAGLIDEVDVFNRQLSAAEIRNIIGADRIGKCKPTVFDAVNDFSLAANPNGAWSYGFSTTRDTPFNLDSVSGVNTDANAGVWAATSNGPFVIHSQDPTTTQYLTIVRSPDVLSLDPSFDRRNAVLRWTAPVAGTYRINGRFEGIDNGRGTTTDAAVLLNKTTTLASSNITGFGAQLPFSLLVTLVAGDVIDFSVGARGDDGLFDSTGLSATIIQQGSTLRDGVVATQSFTYDPKFSQPSSLTDELGHQTLLDIDPANGNVRSITQVIGALGGPDDLVTQFSYTSRGLVDTEIDPLGRVTDYDYDGLGRLVTVTLAKSTADEGVRRFEYDAAGNLAATLDENGKLTEYTYDALNRVTRITEPDPDAAGPLLRPTTALTYDVAGNLTSTTDARGNTTRTEYDTLDRPIKTIDPNTSETVYGYDLAGNLTTVTDPLDQETQYRYDARNRLVETIDPDNGRTKFRYDADDNNTAVTDPVGNVTRHSYDARDRLVRETDPLGNQIGYAYDAADNLIRRTESEATTTASSRQFDNFVDLSGLTLNGAATAINATPVTMDGQVVLRLTTNRSQAASAFLTEPVVPSIADLASFSTSFQFQITGAEGIISDEDGRGADGFTFLLATSPTKLGGLGGDLGFGGIGPSVAVEFDTHNNGTPSDDSGNHVGIDLNGDQTSIVQANVTPRLNDGNVWFAWIDYSDSTQQLEVRVAQTSQRPAEPVVVATVDLAAVLGQDHVFVGFSAGTGGGGSQKHDIRSWQFTAAYFSITARREIVFAYDDVNRRVSETWVGGGNTIAYTYDKATNLLSATDSFSGLAMTYDARDRVRTVDNAGTPGVPNVVLTYAYDPAGNLLSTADTIAGAAGGLNSYTYDGLDRVTRITQSGVNVSDKRVDLGYNPLGQFSSLQRFSDLAGTQLVVGSSYAYDSLNRLTGLHHNNVANTDVAFFDFVYDTDGRITRITDIDGATDYSYDNRDELTAANHTPAVAGLPTERPDESYTYDANGNRLTSSRHGNGYVTGPNNRLFSDGTFNYAYDPEGNLTRRTEIATGNYREFQWDHRNRLTAVIDKTAGNVETQRVEFTYDVFGRRISKSVDTTPEDTVDAAVTGFVYDGQDVLLDFLDTDGSGPTAPALTQRYLHGPAVDQVLAQDNGAGNVLWHLSDHLGTVHDLVDNTSTVANHLTYDSYGNVVSESNPANGTRYRFTAREFDVELVLHYYRARYYDANIGRFISEDPIGFASGQQNSFGYVGNNPAKWVDPTGLERTWDYDTGKWVEGDGGSSANPGGKTDQQWNNQSHHQVGGTQYLPNNRDRGWGKYFGYGQKCFELPKWDEVPDTKSDPRPKRPPPGDWWAPWTWPAPLDPKNDPFGYFGEPLIDQRPDAPKSVSAIGPPDAIGNLSELAPEPAYGYKHGTGRY